jgi:hypothetical protein
LPYAATLPNKDANPKLHVVLAFDAFYEARRANNVQNLERRTMSRVNVPVRIERMWRRAMTTDLLQTSAKIYQFPAGGRRAAGGLGESPKATADLRSPGVPGDVSGGAWYHEAAIQESKRANER